MTVLINAPERPEVVREAATGRAALEAWADTQPDAIVLDHTMPDPSGMDVARAVLAERPEQSIVMFTTHAADPRFARHSPRESVPFWQGACRGARPHHPVVLPPAPGPVAEPRVGAGRPSTYDADASMT